MGNFGLCFVYILIGSIVGSVSSIFFFRMDDSWKKVLTIGSSGGGYFGLITILNKFFEISDENLKILLFLMFLVGFIVCLLVVFCKLCKLLKSQTGENVIRVIDIFLGHKKFIEDYYETRKDEIDKLLKYSDLIKLKEQLENKEKKIKEDRMLLEDFKEKYDEQIKEGISIVLPIDKKVPVTKQFINLFPDYTESYSRFVSNINGYTMDFEKEAKSTKDDINVLLKSYFLAICTFVITDLFESNNSSKVRTHFRFLDDNNEYVSLVATYGSIIYNKQLTPIPKEFGLISKSSKIKRSIIRSLNLDCDFETNNYESFEEYMTLTFGNIRKGNAPFLTMGISVKNKERYKNLMYFLNFCKVENIIQESIDRIGQVCNIINIIDSEYSINRR